MMNSFPIMRILGETVRMLIQYSEFCDYVLRWTVYNFKYIMKLLNQFLLYIHYRGKQLSDNMEVEIPVCLNFLDTKYIFARMRS